MPSKSTHSLFLCYCFHYLDMKVGKRKKNCLSFSRGVSPITEKHASTHNSQTLTHNENQEVRKGGGVERPSPQKQNVPINLGPAGHIHIRLKDFNTQERALTFLTELLLVQCFHKVKVLIS